MWLMTFGIYAGFKWLTWRRTPTPPLPWWRHVAYLLAWPGLDARAFLLGGPLPPGAGPTPREWGLAALELLLGGLLFWGVAPTIPDPEEILRGWVGLVGLILMLHFGSFHLLSCTWRAAGVDARPLMNHPLASTSVSDFWGRRWNTAFRDLTHRFLFRPLTAHWGPRAAIGAGFTFSGLAHELVISVPAGGGYGWPTFYFLVQASALLAERSRFGWALGLGRGWRGWLFTLLVVAGPAYGLFHPPFVRNVVIPFMGVLGAG
jgi:alginate O-acetyltransferase complex protein AlgI